VHGNARAANAAGFPELPWQFYCVATDMRKADSAERRIETCVWAERATPAGGPAWLGAWSTAWRCLRRPAPGFVLVDACVRCPFWRPRADAADGYGAAPQSYPNLQNADVDALLAFLQAYKKK